MKLAFCLFKYHPFGGLERDFMRIASACAQHNHEVHVFTMNWVGDNPHDFNIHLIPKRGFSNHRRAVNFAQHVLPQLQKEQFDAVIGFNRMPGLDLYFAADLCFAKTALDKHSFLFRFTPRFRNYSALEAALFSPDSKTKILTLSNAVKLDYQNYYDTPDDRFILVPPGIQKLNLDIDQYRKLRTEHRQALKIDEKERLLLHVGSNFSLKGLRRSIQAIADLPQQIQSKIKFFILGEGKNKAFKKMAIKLGVADKITFLGNRKDVQHYMLAADLLLHPAHFETAGMVIIEALTCVLPVIVTENCGYAFHVEKAEAGTLIPMPFKQKTFNKTLFDYLNCDLNSNNNRHKLQQHALDYAKKTDLYSLVDKVMATLHTRRE